MLSSLPNDQLVLVAGAAQALCAVGVWRAAGTEVLIGYILLVPLLWVGTYTLASGHMLFALDGLVVLPIIFLGYVCYRAGRRIAEVEENGEPQSETVRSKEDGNAL